MLDLCGLSLKAASRGEPKYFVDNPRLYSQALFSSRIRETILA